MRQRVFSAWAIQTGPFAAHSAHFVPKISTFSTFILGSQFLLPQRANNGKREFSQPQKRMRQWVFSAWNIQTGPFATLLAYFVEKEFPLFHFHTGEPILLASNNLSLNECGPPPLSRSASEVRVALNLMGCLPGCSCSPHPWGECRRWARRF